MELADITLTQLEEGDDAWLDSLPFGVIGMRADGTIARYNLTESKYAGLRRKDILGRHFFDEVGLCMNNFMVAQRFEDEPELNATIDYVLTFRMRPTPVKLRLLQGAGRACSYILIKRLTP